jgi:hypothetical protein
MAAAWRSRLTHGVVNAALFASSLAVLLLLYALALRLTTPRPDPVRPDDDATALVSGYIQVEVRNGCGVDDLGAGLRRFLRAQGFDVVQVENHSRFDVAESHVIDRAGNLDAARQVAAALGLPPERVRQDLRPNLYLDASVVIGHDYATLPPFRTGAPPSTD